MEEVVNVTLSDTEWTPIALPSGQTCDGYIIQSREPSGEFQIKKTLNSSGYFTLHEQLTGIALKAVSGVPGATICYARRVSTFEITIEVIPVL